MMRKYYRFMFVVALLSSLAGCNLPNPTPVQPTGTAVATSPAATKTAPAENTPQVFTSTPAETALAATATQAAPAVQPTATPAPAANPTATVTAPASTPTTAPPSTGALDGYLDDRSTAVGLIQSLFNAINRKEYARAYSYWSNPPTGFAQFAQGYQDTASVQAQTGAVSSDVGAGQLYYSISVVLQVKTTSGQAQTWAGCYNLHLSRPEIQGTPPFQPLAIESGQLQRGGDGADINTMLAHACDTFGKAKQPVTPVPTTDPNTLAASNYLDDLSDPVLVLRSLFNAVNRKEYVRAYSYWETPPVDFAHFQQGYQDTTSVEATFGTPEPGNGAGQIYFRVPVALVAHTSGGQAQTFVGCYQLHLAQPVVQASPPYHPLRIQSANVKQVANDANTSSLLTTACASNP